MIKMKWEMEPLEYKQDGNKIIMTAGKETNLFNSPSGYFKSSNFPFLYVDYEGDFVVTCKIEPSFKNEYDLGCIVIWEDENKWIKFAYENTENGISSIVSVVTDELSDDCNGAAVEGAV